MATIHADMTVGQLVAEHPATARVLERFQIDYCCGGQRMLAEACREQHLDVQEIVREVEGALQPRADTDRNWLCESLANLCDHIEQTHHEYLKSELPRLTELIANVVRAHAERHPELRQAQQVFAALRGELEPHLLKEERILFPAFRQLEQAASPPRFPFGSVANPIGVMQHEHDTAGSALKALRRLTADFTPPDDACIAYRTMLEALGVLEADLHEHIHKENNILFPRAQRLEAA